jgi:hypothetical protein
MDVFGHYGTLAPWAWRMYAGLAQVFFGLGLFRVTAFPMCCLGAKTKYYFGC